MLKVRFVFSDEHGNTNQWNDLKTLIRENGQKDSIIDDVRKALALEGFYCSGNPENLFVIYRIYQIY